MFGRRKSKAQTDEDDDEDTHVQSVLRIPFTGIALMREQSVAVRRTHASQPTSRNCLAVQEVQSRLRQKKAQHEEVRARPSGVGGWR